MTDQSVEEEVRAHFAIWVDPFFYNPTKLRSVGLRLGRWAPWFERFDYLTGGRFIDDTGFFVPQMTPFLFPEATKTYPIPANEAEWDEWRAKAGAREVDAEQSISGVRHLTFAPLMGKPTQALLHNEQEKVPITIEWADVWLFPVGFAGARFSDGADGVGFLVLKVKVVEPATLEDLRTLQALGRWVHPPVTDKRTAQISVDGRADIALRDAIDGLIQEFIGPPPPATLALGDPLPPHAVRATTTELGMAYGQIQRTLLFVVVGGGAGAATAPFSDRRTQLLFELSIGARAEGDWLPAARQVEALSRDSLLEYWQGWSALALWDNLTIVGDASGFLERWTSANVEGDYLVVWLTTLFQFLRLESLSRQIIVRSEDLQETHDTLELASDALLEFRNHYVFTDVTLQPLGRKLHRLLHLTLEVPTRMESVALELEAMRSRYAERVRARTEVLLERLNFGLVPATVCGTTASVLALSGYAILSAILLGLALSFLVLRLNVVRQILVGKGKEPPAGAPARRGSTGHD